MSAAAPSESRAAVVAGEGRGGAGGGGAGGGGAGGSVAEMRVVSVLFNDLVGFTTLSESMPAEDVRELQSGYFAAARAAVARYGGVIEKFIGDAVMAVFGAEVSTGDDAERAIRAALELVKSVSDLGASLGLELRARAGICTGRTAVVAAEGEGLVTGDTVNSAARIQAAAGEGHVFVDEATRSLAAGEIDFEAAGSFELKGKALPLHLFRVIGPFESIVLGAATDQQSGAATVPFVGREGSLNEILLAAAAAWEESSFLVATVTGAAGAGKTRFTSELFRRVHERYSDVKWQTGRCLAFGDGVANSALAQAFRSQLGIPKGVPVSDAADLLSTALRSIVPDAELRRWIQPRIAALLGLLPGAEPFLRDELFGSWRALLEQMAREGPVVLVIDDTEHIDDSTAGFLGRLRQWSASHPILLVIVGRDGCLDRLSWQGTDETARRVDIRLEPLLPEETSEIITLLAPGLTDRSVSTLAAAAEGNPLFAIELLRSLADRGILGHYDGTYEVVGDETSLVGTDLPPTLGALTGARLDSLPQAERQLVRDLSVFGMNFSRVTAPAVCGPSPGGEPFDLLIDSLLARQVLVELKPDDSAYGDLAFSSTLLRSVAYERLTRRERRSLHLAAALHLEAGRDRVSPELVGQEAGVVEMVASHYSAALVAVPEAADAPEVRRRAVLAYMAAGDRALQVGHTSGAEKHYLNAGELASGHDIGVAARAFEKAGEASNVLGGFRRAIENFNKAAQLYSDGGATRAAARAKAHAAGSGIRIGSVNDGISELKEALRILDIGAPDLDQAKVAWRLGSALLVAGREDEANQYLESALNSARSLQDWSLLVQALTLSGYRLDILGQGAEAANLYNEAVELARHHRLERQLADALTHGGESKAVNDLAGADAWGEEALVVFARFGDLPNASLVAANVLLLFCFTGRWNEIDGLVADYLEGAGCEYVHAKMALFESWRGDGAAARQHLGRASAWAESELVASRSIYRIGKAGVDLLEDRPSAAAASAGEVAAEFHDRADLFNEEMRLAWPLALEGAVAAGDVANARRLHAMLAELPEDRVPPYLVGERLRLGSHVLLRADDAGAERDLRRAVELFGRLGYPFHRAKAETDLAYVLLGRGADEPAALVATAAIETLASLGAAPALQRARAVLELLSIS